MTTRHNGVRATIALGIVSVLAIGLLTAESATAARTKANYYTATVDGGSNSNVRYATASSGTPTTVNFTVTNCGAAFSPPSSCTNVKGTSLDSIVISLPAGWTAVNAASLTASGLKLAPGASVTMPVAVYPSLTAAGTARGVSFCVSDSTACSYQPATTNPTLTLPLKFTFSVQPKDGMPTSSICGTRVQLTDGFSPTADNVPLGGVSVSLAAAADSLVDPSLDSTVTQITGPTTGAATFGCTPNPAVGGPYKIVAVGQNAGASIPSDDSNPFVVYTKLQNCNNNCSDSQTGGGGTNLNATSNAAGVLGTSVFDVNDGHFPSFGSVGCADVKKLVGRPDVLQAASSDGAKTVVITWSKIVTLKFTDNGTPHWQVCMAAPDLFTTDGGGDAVLNSVTGLYEGTVPLCGAAPAGNPCMAISRNAAQEIATITLPDGWAGDPYFH